MERMKERKGLGKMQSNIFSRMTQTAWKRDLFGTVTFSCFTAVTVMMFSLSILLFTNLTGAIDHLMNLAKTPDFLQMHSGDLEQDRLEAFVKEREDVAAWQVCRFLNLDNSILYFVNQSLLDSTQDNGICVQPKEFDFLLGMDNQLPKVEEGTVWVPVCYQKKYDVKVGDSFLIGDQALQVAGFIRDAQMNSMMASSKRFLVAEEDYERLYSYGSEEYLIEYLLQGGADVGDFQNAYENSELPGNGPAITRSLIKMMNALSDGIMIFILVLISFMVLLISMVCIRFMLFTKMQDEKKEIGLLKAVGISGKDIKAMFLRRYIVLIGIGTGAGFVLSLLLSGPLSEQMRRLYGTGENSSRVILLSALCAVALGALILCYLNRLMKKLNEMTAIQVLSGKEDQGKRKDGMFCVFFVSVIVVFLMLVPANLYSTMSSEKFVTYMGIGNSQIRMDIRQTEDISGKQEVLQSMLMQDERVEQFAMFRTSQIPARLADGEMRNLLVEQGNHTMFPLSYSQGRAPEKAGEIALSYLLAEDMNLQVGDLVCLKLAYGDVIHEDVAYEDVAYDDVMYQVCGIYSDITNGGKTAKVASLDKTYQLPVMWSVVYLNLKQEFLNHDAWLDEWAKDYQMEGIEISDIHQRIEGTYGQTLSQVKQVSLVVKLVAAFIMILVLSLFLRLLVSKERLQISMKKAMGFSAIGIRNGYDRRALGYLVTGMITGLVVGNLAGEKICGMVLRSFGANGFRFVINPWQAFCWIPVIALAAGILAMGIGTMEIKKIMPVECLRGRE